MGAIRAGLRRLRRTSVRAAATPRLVEVAAHGDAVTHYVSDDELGAVAQGRTPSAVCGQVVVPAGLTVVPGPLCPLCTATQLRRSG